MQIHCSAKHGDLEGVRLRLRRGVDVDVREEHSGRTPLHWACESREATPAMVEVLLASGADIEAVTDVHDTPLRLAVKTGNLAKLKLLLARGADARAAPGGYTPLMPVPYLDNAIEMARVLLDAGVDPSVRSNYGETAVCIASGIARFDLLRLLLDRGADPTPLSWDQLLRAIAIGEPDEALRSIRQLSEPPTSRDFYDRSALLMALHRGDLALVDAISDLGGDVDSHRSRCGTTALMHAVVGDRRDVVAWCLVHGTDPNATNEFGETALMKAAGQGSVRCIRTLIAANADLDAESDTGSKAITESRDAAVVAALVAAGADLDAIDGTGYGLLKYAAEVGNLPFTLDLLRMGANPEATSTGDTALHMATAQDELAIMRGLLAHGARVNAQDVDGWTPLFSARSVEAVRMLLEQGADPNVGSITGMRAVDWIARTNEEAAALVARKAEVRRPGS